MAYFPLCINLDGAEVILLGEGPMAQEKRSVLLSFGANIRQFSDAGLLTETELEPRPAMVVVADVPHVEKERISRLCRRRGIPVNVVDEPALCTFYFPSLVTRGSLTVAVSTGGKSPVGAAWLRRHLEKHIPDQTEEILEWAQALRRRLRTDYPEADRRAVLRRAVSLALTENRVLREQEVLTILESCIEKE